MAIFLAILNALVAIPKIAGYVEDFAAAVTEWYIQRQQQQTLQKIADAAAMAARAQTDEERYQAADAWHAIFTSGRVSK